MRASRPKDPDAGAVAAVSVTVAVVQQRDLPLTITAAGRAEAKALVSVKSRLDGQVAEVAYKEGQPVHKGQLLLRFDTAVLEAQQRQAEGVLARDEAQLAKATSDYQRNVALVAKGFIAKTALSQFEADLGTTKANLKSDQASLDNAHLQLDHARITAPMDGVAGALLLPVGGAAMANNTTLLVINQVDPIYVTFPLPESQLAHLKLAMGKGDVPVSATIEGIDKQMRGKLAFIDNAVDTTSGTIIAKAIFDNPDGMLTPGQFAQVSVQLDTLHNALVVPSQAVESGVDGPYAFVVNADATVAIRQLAVGADTTGYRVVTSGLAAGDRVVMTGQAQLRNQAKVNISTTPSAASEQP
ncbi:MAG TPA: efflux RND transporter periplasmic adaptor subunit [Xanthomonadaceae bacterium]|nr:efflux RND transporter periplasmic adaptor subunit [Xanthomonadaceae bacterium]